MPSLRKNFCCVMYGHNLGESFGKDLADKINEEYGIGTVKIGWETITKDVFDTMVDNMKESVYAFFVYTKDMKKNYARWFEDATKIARTVKEKGEVIFVVIQPYTVDALHDENQHMTHHNPIQFDANYISNADKWKELLGSMKDKAVSWKRQHAIELKRDPREKSLLDLWRRFLQDQWSSIADSAFLVNIEDTLISGRVVEMEMVEALKNERLTRKKEMIRILENVMRASEINTIKSFFQVLELKEVATFNKIRMEMDETLKCDYSGKPCHIPMKTESLVPSLDPTKKEENLTRPFEESGEPHEPMDVSDAASGSDETLVKQRIPSETPQSMLADSCHKCRTKYSRQKSNFCDSCGEKRERVTCCKRCHKEVMAKENFCPECGLKQK